MSTVSAGSSDLVQNPYLAIQAQVESLQAKGQDVIRLDIGSPDLAPPDEVIQVLYRSAQDPGHHGYQSHRGTPELRQAWARHYRRQFGVVLDPEGEILPLAGSKEGVFHLAQVWLSPGDVVLVPDPGYQTYRVGATFAGAEVITVALRGNRNARLDLHAVPTSVARRARLMWLNFPGNPTGATVSIDFFKQALAFAREYDLLLCHDAAYTQVTFDGFRAPSLMQVEGAQEVALEFNTLSKSHNMAGWRTGVAVGNPSALELLLRYKGSSESGQFRPVMDAACRALAMPSAWIEARNKTYARRRRMMLAGLRHLGIELEPPRGGLYLWFAHPTGWRSFQFCQELLQATGVSLAPGALFGATGEGFVRLALVAPEDRLQQALHRIGAAWPLPMG